MKKLSSSFMPLSAGTNDAVIEYLYQFSSNVNYRAARR